MGIIDRFIDGLFKNQLYGNYNLSSGYMSNSNVNDGKKSKDKCS